MKRPIVVMKFGGSSVKDTERLKNAAARVVETQKAGKRVVVVVSAPGDMTDDLIEKAHSVTPDPDARELDMLMATGEQISIALLCMAVKSMGVEAISLTGPQAGIRASDVHTKARITTIRPVKLTKELNAGKVVVVAGFQGLNTKEDIVTLGRGGSDLTAVALAAALKSDVCEIYTDVIGVFTADPRIVPEAEKIDHISYDEMLELAGSGAQVMQARSIEVAKKYGVKVHVKSSLERKEGTIIGQSGNEMEAPVVSGVAYDKNEARLSIVDVPDRPGVAATVFGALAKDNINVDMIIQSSAQEGKNDISFTVSRTDVKRAMLLLESVREKLGARAVVADEGIAKVSIIGVGMRSHPGVAAKMFQSLAEAGINIEMISTSEIKIACVIPESEGPRAIKLLHKAFGLGK
ncbi:MAG: aspartate kinase [Elusimicrobia bacterium]|nr:aspartate kinase [Candidatus Obscuribacterium magneticum]